MIAVPVDPFPIYMKWKQVLNGATNNTTFFIFMIACLLHILIVLNVLKKSAHVQAIQPEPYNKLKDR